MKISNCTLIQNFFLAFLVCPLLLISACGGGSKTTTTTAQVVPIVLDTVGNVFGVVTDRVSHLPLREATISVGGASVKSGSDGSFSIANLPLGRTTVSVRAVDHASTAVIVHLNANQGSQRVRIELLPIGSTQSFDPTVQQSLIDSASIAQVTLPANAFVSATGAAPVGNVSVEITRIDPGVDSTVMPGDYSVGAAKIESFGAVNFEFRDSVGNSLNLAPGKIAEIHIPVASNQVAAPSTIPLYFFNDQTGMWIQEGSATLVGTGADAYYKGNVSHFSCWNADQLIDVMQVCGKVLDDAGKPVVGVTVASVGVDYVGRALAVTDALGNFCVAAKTNSNMKVFAFLNDFQSVEVALKSTTVKVTLPTALILPSFAAARITLGDPTVILVQDTCCNFPEIQIPFSITGVSISHLPLYNGLLQARWELSHTMALTCVFTGVNYDCVGAGTISTTPWLVYWGDGKTPTRIDSAASQLNGIMAFKASVHYRSTNEPSNATLLGSSAVTFTAVLAVDIRNPVTGVISTIRSNPRFITVP